MKHSRRRHTRHRKYRGGNLKSVNEGLDKIGNTAIKGVPGVEKGLSTVYNTMSRGVNYGLKSAKSISRSVGMSGGRRRRRYTRKHK